METLLQAPLPPPLDRLIQYYHLVLSSKAPKHNTNTCRGVSVSKVCVGEDGKENKQAIDCLGKVLQRASIGIDMQQQTI